jgi:hypothetical protein
MRGKRKKLAPGIWRDKSGISIVVHTRLGQTEERHPLDTELGKLKRRREALRVLERERARVAAGRAVQPARRRHFTTLAEDVDTYLKTRAAMPTIRDRTRQLQNWVAVFGERQRIKLAPHEIQQQRDAWLLACKSPAWVNLHLRALSNLYRTLDPDAPNPVRRVPEADEPNAIPRAIPSAVVAAIFESMQPSRAKRLTAGTPGDRISLHRSTRSGSARAGVSTARTTRSTRRHTSTSQGSDRKTCVTRSAPHSLSPPAGNVATVQMFLAQRRRSWPTATAWPRCHSISATRPLPLVCWNHVLELKETLRQTPRVDSFCIGVRIPAPEPPFPHESPQRG